MGIVYASATPSPELLGLFEKAAQVGVRGIGTGAIYEMGEHYMLENEKTLDLKALSRVKPLEYSGKPLTSFKVRVNDPELDMRVNDLLRRKLKITRISTAMKMKLCVRAYIYFQEKEAYDVPKSGVSGDGRYNPESDTNRNGGNDRYNSETDSDSDGRSERRNTETIPLPYEDFIKLSTDEKLNEIYKLLLDSRK